MTKKQKLGLWMILTPFICWFAALLLQSVNRFITTQSGSGIIGSSINIISLLIGLIGFIGFLPLVVVGIMFLASSKKS